MSDLKINNSDIVEFIIKLINEFARVSGYSEYLAYLYLKNHDAINFIIENYDMMHTLDINSNLESLKNFCDSKK